jgi:hypothetical protein
MEMLKLVGVTTKGADPPDPPTVNVTGTMRVPPLNCCPVMVMLPLYVPATKLEGSADTFRLAGVELLKLLTKVGLTESHVEFPFDVLAAAEMAAALAVVVTWSVVVEGVVPTAALRVIDVGFAAKPSVPLPVPTLTVTGMVIAEPAPGVRVTLP